MVPVDFFAEDEKGFELTITATGAGHQIVEEQSCSFHGTQGNCVHTDVIYEAGSPKTTVVTSFTGIPTPVYTITQTSGSTLRSGGTVFSIAVGSMGCLMALTTPLWL